MDSTISQRLDALGLALPEIAAPAAQYVPWTMNGNLVLTSGQLPLRDGKLTTTGLLGKSVDIEAGQEAAKWCAMNVLAQLNAAAGSLEAVEKILKITVFVASAPDFTQQHVVANGASGLLVEVLGDAVGSHARSAVGMASLPLDAPVEVEAIAKIRT